MLPACARSGLGFQGLLLLPVLEQSPMAIDSYVKAVACVALLSRPLDWRPITTGYWSPLSWSGSGSFSISVCNLDSSRRPSKPQPQFSGDTRQMDLILVGWFSQRIWTCTYSSMPTSNKRTLTGVSARPHGNVCGDKKHRSWQLVWELSGRLDFWRVPVPGTCVGLRLYCFRDRDRWTYMVVGSKGHYLK